MTQMPPANFSSMNRSVRAFAIFSIQPTQSLQNTGCGTFPTVACASPMTASTRTFSVSDSVGYSKQCSSCASLRSFDFSLNHGQQSFELRFLKTDALKNDLPFIVQQVGP